MPPGRPKSENERPAETWRVARSAVESFDRRLDRFKAREHADSLGRASPTNALKDQLNGSQQQVLKTRLLLMPHGQNRDHIVVDAIAGHITAISEIDQPVPISFEQVLDPPAHSGMRAQILHTLNNRFTGTFGSRGTLWAQARPEPFEVTECPGGEDYVWHSGGGSSPSVPQVASQVSTSSAVA